MQGNEAQTVAELVARLEGGWRLHIHTLYDLRVGPHWGFSQRRVPDWHLLYVRSGRGWYYLAGEPVRLEPGRVLVLAPGVPHAARPEPGDPPSIVPLRCGLEVPAGAPAWRPEPVAVHRRLQGPAAVAMEQCCDRLSAWWQAEGDPAWIRLHLRHQLTGFLLAALGPDALGWTSPGDPLAALRARLRSNPHERPSVARMAREVGLSEKHFIRVFRQRYGETPRAFHIRMRCERAIWLLGETGESVGAIALELGYPDSATFCKQFKQVTGSTPLACRRRGGGPGG